MSDSWSPDFAQRTESVSSSYSFSTRPSNLDTPTHTTTASASDPGRDTASISSRKSSSTFTISGAMASVPEPNHTYMIREVNLDMALTVKNGALTLQSHTDGIGGWQWHCEQRDSGWMGFRDTVSGRYLGRDNRGGFIVQAQRLDDWESFVIRHRKTGGYNLCVKYGHTLKPMGVTGGKSAVGPKLADAPGPEKAALWVFIEI
ncbi:hypothetical protein F5Y14DRAFT_447685 [Nemania sp. NC0429]|nr:hypothetical protein F5Y14DRAFT_447685 [Nemania sp. NC0429]